MILSSYDNLQELPEGVVFKGWRARRFEHSGNILYILWQLCKGNFMLENCILVPAYHIRFSDLHV